ncbi:hypothetical protein G3N56_07020 [Desulfovibrio sulfodismutans]|uniref:Uncharacterized protein n=1 Tax=Desulfolutivibrio sulfodismutans TaxID=63561 RepID=A0A7K3NJW7_9BACT|nr:hypothetical protein [Desulfolutivibrio sulfodismutans]NDY56494.1 hypothetical protein [Desulfolutivibrio sulfodismutans]QLA12586.1 hypothetical protein GD606_10025 [Desulfolutivibrio sulfodismutans DSM 3696]
MFASEKTPRIGDERRFDYGRSLLYTIYRHASGLPDAEAARMARQAAARRHGEAALPDSAASPGSLSESLGERLERLRSPRSLALPA